MKQNCHGCEVDFPKIILIDQDTSMMKAIKKAKVNLIDMDTVLRKNRNIQFKLVQSQDTITMV